MIKIEIPNLLDLDPHVLRETGRYLMALGEEAQVETAVEAKPEPTPVVSSPAVVPPPPPIPPVASIVPPTPQPIEKKPDSVPTPPPPPPVPDTPPVTESAPPVPNAAEVFKKPKAPEVELDADGYPWDSRIHARTKSKTQDGRWKKMRGISADVVEKVQAELKKVQDIPTPPPAPVPASGSSPSFADLMSLVTRSITDGKLKREQVIDVLKPFNIPALPLLATRLDMIPAVMDALNEVIKNGAQ